MTISRRKFSNLAGALTFGFGTSSSQIVSAQAYPSRPVRFIVPFPPGGGTDFVARLLSEKFALGQPMVVENRGGAGGTIGTELVARSEPDGHTILMVTGSHTTNLNIYPNLSYDTLKDFTPITQTVQGNNGVVLLAHPSVPANTLPQLIALAKSKPGGISYGSTGSGQIAHLAMELLKFRGGFEAVHVPYKGTAPALQDLLAGHVQVAMFTQREMSYVRAGKLKALAVAGPQRMEDFPDLPTVAESGFPGFLAIGWHGLVVRAGTSPEIVATLHKEFSRILALPDIRAKLKAQTLEPIASTPQAFDAYIKSEIVIWGDVIKRVGVKVD
ncbi:tripartite tricarboxylate transporter substrate binding protein [Comamonadaceae bacterium G21597-S1]|nr:tripartite tricarboxylate transporter substrate binding protein [Comamonadaceae bacterium G21597-S1]